MLPFRTEEASEGIRERRTDAAPKLGGIGRRMAQALEGMEDAPSDAQPGIGQSPVQIEEHVHRVNPS